MGGKSCCDFLSHSCIQRQGDVLLVVLEFVLFSILFFIPECLMSFSAGAISRSFQSDYRD